MDHRPLYTIAKDIKNDWINIRVTARQYLIEMQYLSSITEREARSTVLHFLGNATAWKGPVAHIIKNELLNMLNNEDEGKKAVEISKLHEVIKTFPNKFEVLTGNDIFKIHGVSAYWFANDRIKNELIEIIQKSGYKIEGSYWIRSS